jgi:hypothetical protein
MRREEPRAWRAWFVALLGLALALWAPPASAYPWMIHHGYTSCAQCHVDPSGGGVITAYGRAQSEILLRTHFSGEIPENPGKIKDFLFGAFPLPEPVALQVDVRDLLIPDPADPQVILMQADLRGAVQTEKFVASASIGTVSRGAEQAAVVYGDTWKLVSREYWAGVSPSKAFTIRAGRMNLPFGIRATRTTVNDEQQTGVSVFWNNRKFRGELMGIAGNFQLRPDSFRDRGYSMYLAYAPETTLELGVSSLFTSAQTDLETFAPRTRFAEGVFTRWAPVDPLAILLEGDVLFGSNDGQAATGFVSTAIVDYEPVQGLHLQAIGEQCDDDFGDGASSAITATGAAQWFVLPHFDFRVDGGYGTVSCTPGVQGSPFGLVQAHFFL